MRKQSLFQISKRDTLPLGKALLIRGGILLLAVFVDSVRSGALKRD